MPVFPFFTTAIWPSHASLPLKIRLRFEVCELCSSHSFRLTNIRSKPWAEPWNIFFFCLSFGSHNRSFDPSVVNEQPASLFPVLVMAAFSFGIAAFLETASLGASFSCLVILAFVLNEYLTPTGPFDSSNLAFPLWLGFGPCVWVHCNFLQSDLELQSGSHIWCWCRTIWEMEAGEVFPKSAQ